SGCINLASITVDKDNQYYLSENSVMFDKQKTILIAYPAKKSDASYQVPSTVTSILASAFYACENLVNISIPTGVTSIGSLAFYGCSSLESIVIPNGVTTISANTFYGCGSLESMTLPFVGESRTATSGSGLFGFIFGTTNYVGSVETNQYFSATQSTAYYIPSSLRTVIITDTRNLQYGAFYDCANLENIVIPNGVTSISSNTFHGCGSLKSISLPFVGGSRTITSGNAMLGYIFGTTTYEGSTATNQYYTPTLFTTYYIPTTLSTVIITGASMIQSGAFSGVSSLTSISVPFIGASRTATGNTALLGYIFGTINYTGSTPTTQYYSSTQFTTYYIPTNLASVVISDPTTIPYGAFYNCSSLLSISISSSAESISENAFYNCFNLDNISLPFIGASRTATEGSALFGYIFGTTYYLGSTATTQYFNSHSSITYFIPTLLRTVVITDGSEIPFGAFYNCSGVTSITLPSSVTKIGDSAFSDCSGITSITLPTGLTSLGSSAFFGCSGLSRVFIPQSVTTIGDNAFNGCINITIYVKVNSKPIGWSIDWNSTNRPVVWGAQA
ncbi:MAG: leucine-rich repeat protein, partial [Candidatus Izemoplasmatales bacterium]|nr:leucine-rich repeat protein [Candidatus Izemoplasmatales bacterium]